MSVSTESAAPHWRINLIVCALGSFTTIVGMTLILPILPLYVRDLGVEDPAAVTAWSGIAYAATFLTAALAAPLWGWLGDRYGRKPMLVRASLGMAVAMSLIGLAQDVQQLVAVRLLVGLLGGYASGSTILVAAQAPRGRSAWALGVLSSAIMSGTIVGPLLGGAIAQAFGVTLAFLSTGALIFVAFIGTAVFLREDRSAAPMANVISASGRGGWRAIPRRGTIIALLGLSALLMFATISVEPIITVHIERLTSGTEHVAIFAAVVFSLTALGTILSGPWLGRLADRVGHLRVLTWSLVAATGLLALQAAVPELWSFAALRFATGLALGGITPTVVATIRRLVPSTSVGLVLGYNVSAQYIGQVTGPVLAGFMGGALGTPSVFVATAVLTAVGIVAVAFDQAPDSGTGCTGRRPHGLSRRGQA